MREGSRFRDLTIVNLAAFFPGENPVVYYFPLFDTNAHAKPFCEVSNLPVHYLTCLIDIYLLRFPLLIADLK